MLEALENWVPITYDALWTTELCRNFSEGKTLIQKLIKGDNISIEVRFIKKSGTN